MRRGAHLTARGTFRPRWLSAIAAALLLIAGIAAFTSAAQGGGSTWARTPIHAPNLNTHPSFGDLRDAPFIRDLPFVGR